MGDEESVVVGIDIEAAQFFHERWDQMGWVNGLEIHYCLQRSKLDV